MQARTMTDPFTASDCDRLCDLADYGHMPGNYAETGRFIAAAERITNAAREILRPKAATPSHARILRYPIAPKD